MMRERRNWGKKENKEARGEMGNEVRGGNCGTTS